LSICDELITFFEAHQTEQTTGVTAGGIDLNQKKSTDLIIRPRDVEQPGYEVISKYISQLFSCHQAYLEQWPFLKGIIPSAEIASFNIQRYLPGDHFQHLHSERTSISSSLRVLAWMTYLNDVEDGGSTYFSHQDMDVQPQKGLTLIWPAEWTHAHLGNVVNSGSKYVITGWIHFSR
jgi:hypothetical protein